MSKLVDSNGKHQARSRNEGDLNERGEPKQATNKVMSFAIVAAVVIGIAMFVWGSVILKKNHYTDATTTYSAPLKRVNGQQIKTADSANPKNDVSNVGKQAVSGDALVDTQIGDQK